MEWVSVNGNLVLLGVVGAILLLFGGWPIWILMSLVLSSLRWLWALYTFVRLIFDVGVYVVLQWTHSANKMWNLLTCPREIRKLRTRLYNAGTFKEWLQIAEEIDENEGKEEWKQDPAMAPADFDQEMLKSMTQSLEEKRARGDMKELMFLLGAIIKRNALGLDKASLHVHCLAGTKACITQFITQVEACLIDVCCCDSLSVADKISFFNKCKLNLGRTALSLSGGGSLGMYHMGVLVALIEGECLPNVITGASGGSIVAGMLACKTTQELLQDICVNDISTRFAHEGVRWFPPVFEQALNFWANGVLIQGEDFEKCTQRYYGDITFQEAYERTGRHVTITVSASSTHAMGTFKLLLNHVTEPRVTVASAVRASCALPGIMRPATLHIKGPTGEIIPYYLSKDRKFVDGSVTSDIPRNRIISTFNVTNFVVSQVNPHIVPFLDKSADPSKQGALRKLEEMANLDIRYRCQILAKLQVIPNLFGQDISKVFNQIYVGNVTVVPRLTTVDLFKTIMNPTPADMDKYLSEGKRATFPKLPYIRHLTQLERRIARCLNVLHNQRREAGELSSASIPPSVSTSMLSVDTNHGRLSTSSNCINDFDYDMGTYDRVTGEEPKKAHNPWSPVRGSAETFENQNYAIQHAAKDLVNNQSDGVDTMITAITEKTKNGEDSFDNPRSALNQDTSLNNNNNQSGGEDIIPLLQRGIAPGASTTLASSSSSSASSVPSTSPVYDPLSSPSSLISEPRSARTHSEQQRRKNDVTHQSGKKSKQKKQQPEDLQVIKGKEQANQHADGESGSKHAGCGCQGCQEEKEQLLKRVATLEAALQNFTQQQSSV